MESCVCVCVFFYSPPAGDSCENMQNYLETRLAPATACLSRTLHRCSRKAGKGMNRRRSLATIGTRSPARVLPGLVRSKFFGTKTHFPARAWVKVPLSFRFLRDGYRILVVYVPWCCCFFFCSLLHYWRDMGLSRGFFCHLFPPSG